VSYQQVLPWVRDLLVSYKSSIHTLRMLQQKVRGRCQALLRPQGQVVRLGPEHLAALQETVSEVELLLETGRIASAKRLETALDLARRELMASRWLLESGTEMVEATEELLDAIRQMQTVLRAARGLTQAGTLRAALPSRMGDTAGQAKEAFPECAFCPARKACPLRDLPLLSEGIGDLTYCLEWLQNRYQPYDMRIGSDGTVRRKKRHVQPVDPGELLPLAERLGRLEPSPEELFLSAQEEEDLRKLLCGKAGLTDRQWQAVRLCYLDGYSTWAAAPLMGCVHQVVVKQLLASEQKYRDYLGMTAPMVGRHQGHRRRRA